MTGTFSKTCIDIDYKTFILLILCYSLVYAINNIVAENKMMTHKLAELSLVEQIHNTIIEKLKNIEHFMFFDKQFQDLYTNIIDGCKEEPANVIYSMVYLITNLVKLIVSGLIIFRFDYYVLIILVLSLIPSVIFKLKIQKNYVKVWQERSSSIRYYDYCFGLMSQREPVKEIKNFNVYDYFIGKHRKQYEDNYKIWYHFFNKELILSFITQNIGATGLFYVLYIIIKRTYLGKTDVADFVFISSIISSFQIAYSGTIENLVSHSFSMTFMVSFFKFINLPQEMYRGKQHIKLQQKYCIEFDNVSFKYKNDDEYILRNINCRFMSGDRVCILGDNGSGKTTLINLIMRVYDPSEGTICLNGVDIREYDIEQYRSLISSINQNYIKYAIKIKDTVSLGNKKDFNNLSKIKSACKQATANNFIRKLKRKYDSDLTKYFYQEGEELSEGQWQKLAIARVFFSEAPILIFDEPTAALDPQSELDVYKQIEKEEPDKIKIFISHRLYCSKKATKILIIQNGIIIANNTHDELIKNNREYKIAYEKQLKKYL